MKQRGLFEGDDEAQSASRAMVAVPGSVRHLTPEQRTFNRLTESIRRQREELATWEAFVERFTVRLAGEMQPVEDEIHAAQRRLVERLDAVLQDKTAPLGRRHRAKARHHLLEVVDNLLEAGADPELEALFEKHSGVTAAQRNQEQVEIAEAMIGGVFGPETLRGHQARDLEELLRHADAQLQGRAEADERRRERRRGKSKAGARAQREAERKAQAAREASRTVREVYRKLVSALHPDRETDPAERERKTRLMQRANRAYEKDDLLELLALQVEIEQIDAGALAEVPEERLRHYNQVLREQLQALEMQTEERVMPFRIEFDLDARIVTPKDVDRALDARIGEARAFAANIEHSVAELDDPRRRRALLDTLPGPTSDAEELAALAELDAIFADAPTSGAPPPRRRRRKKGKKAG